MQVTETHSEGLKRGYKVQITAAEMDGKISGRLEELGGQVKVPGFRTGKVPIGVLKQRFGKSVMGEILERAVNDSSSQALNERGLRPAMQPKIEITSFDEGKDLEYTMEIEILPEIETMDFSKLNLERCQIKIDESSVDETLADLSKSHKKTKPLDTPRKTATGDVLVIDFRGSVGGEELPGMSAEDHHLELGSSSFIEGFEEQLIGAEIGETREINVTFPEEYANERLAGQGAVFVVNIKNILESMPVEIDDDFAVSVGEENLEALKTRVRERIGSEYKGFARARLKRHLLDLLAEAHDFAVPESMVDIEFETIWKQIEEDRKQGKVDAGDEDKSEDVLKAEYRVIAERRVRLGLLISEVGQRNGVDVTQEEVNQALLREAQQYPGKEREVFEFYQKTPAALANLRAPIFEDKVVDFIIDLAQVKDREMTVDQLRKEMEEEMSAESSTSKKKPAKKSAKSGKADKPAKTAKKSSSKKKAAKKTS